MPKGPASTFWPLSCALHLVLISRFFPVAISIAYIANSPLLHSLALSVPVCLVLPAQRQRVNRHRVRATEPQNRHGLLVATVPLHGWPALPVLHERSPTDAVQLSLCGLRRLQHRFSCSQYPSHDSPCLQKAMPYSRLALPVLHPTPPWLNSRRTCTRQLCTEFLSTTA